MLVHFIFLVKQGELEDRSEEFGYVQEMAQFYKKWIKKTFDMDVDVQSDQMVVQKRSILQRVDTHTLLDDHKRRGQDIFHYYLCNFRPLWTDCTCEGYYAENFGMSLWVKPKEKENMVLFLAEKNCTVVSHELSHELLRQKKVKKQAEMIHEVWTRHLFDDHPFEMYGKNFEPTTKDPYFLTIDTSSFRSK